MWELERVFSQYLKWLTNILLADFNTKQARGYFKEGNLELDFT